MRELVKAEDVLRKVGDDQQTLAVVVMLAELLSRRRNQKSTAPR